MKALSVRQPYALWLITGEKTIEWRSWSTKHRGELLICSSSQRSSDFEFLELTRGEIKEMMPLGVAVGVVTLVAVREFTKDDLDAAAMEEIPDPPGYAWIVENPIEIEPFPVKGKLHLFDVNVQWKESKVE